MKQFNFSNLIAVVAILLCFYAFSNDKKASPQETEKEFCFARIDAKYIRMSYSDGKYEEENIDAFVTDNKDGFLLRISCKKVTEMTNAGWDFVEINKDYNSNASIYIFERSK